MRCVITLDSSSETWIYCKIHVAELDMVVMTLNEWLSDMVVGKRTCSLLSRTRIICTKTFANIVWSCVTLENVCNEDILLTLFAFIQLFSSLFDYNSVVVGINL